MLSMDELSTRLTISKQSLYKLINNNQELSALIKEHSTKQKRKIFYDDVVFEWLCQHYGIKPGVSNEVVEGISQEGNEIIPEAPAATSAARIAELEAQVKELEAKLKSVEEERQRLHQENGALLLTVSQMSNTISQMSNTAFQQFQASVKMLPAPRKSLFERIKDVFGGKGKQAPQEAPEAPQDAAAPQREREI